MKVMRNNFLKNFRSPKQIMNLASSIKFDDVENVREDDQDVFQEGKKLYIKHFTTYRRMANETIKIKKIQKTTQKKIAVVHRYSANELRKEGNLKTILDREFDVIGIEQYGRRLNYAKKEKNDILYGFF